MDKKTDTQGQKGKDLLSAQSRRVVDGGAASWQLVSPPTAAVGAHGAQLLADLAERDAVRWVVQVEAQLLVVGEQLVVAAVVPAVATTTPVVATTSPEEGPQPPADARVSAVGGRAVAPGGGGGGP